MPLNSKYNNYSERDKQVSNLEHLDKIDANTDQVEGKLDTLNVNTDQVENLLSSIESEIGSHLGVIEGKLDSMESVLNDIKNNTANN